MVFMDKNKKVFFEYASKLSGDKEKLSTQFSEIGQIVGEASTWAKLDKSKIVTKKYFCKACKDFFIFRLYFSQKNV